MSEVVHECKRCRNIEIDDPLEFGEIAVKELVAVCVGARDQDQQAHLELGGRRRDASAGIGGAQIGLHGTDLDAVPAALVGRLLQRVCFASNQHQVQTRLGEKLGEFGAHTL